MNGLDNYIEEVVKKGDEGSALLAALCAPTLRDKEFIDVITEGMQGIAVARFPEDYLVIAHSLGGDPSIKDTEEYSASMVENLVQKAKAINVHPIAIADVIDANNGEKSLIKKSGNAIVNAANDNNLAILNGELAILGRRVNCEANVSGTMISIAKKKDFNLTRKTFEVDGTKYFVFDPKGKAVYMNSDGIGTKTEFYERAELYELGLADSIAMKADDASKVAAEIVVMFDVVETKGLIPINKLEEHAKQLGQQLGFEYILQHEAIEERIMGYKDDVPSYNVSGTAISLIDEERLRNPLKPKAGEFLIAISGRPNPRSNGITAKREAMIDLLGDDWHETKIGKMFLEFLAEPSTIFYPLFKELIETGLATSVYHMSGGAYKSKLAKPLAKHGLFVDIGNNLFIPDWREIALKEATNTTTEAAYEKWPMNNEAFITTKNPIEAEKIISKYNLKPRFACELEETNKTGIEFLAYSGEKIKFTWEK